MLKTSSSIEPQSEQLEASAKATELLSTYVTFKSSRAVIILPRRFNDTPQYSEPSH